jgi:cytochrome b involved in lipid metabolism
MEDVAKHTPKPDCWGFVGGQMHGVTNFLMDHLGGEWAILTFADNDAT